MSREKQQPSAHFPQRHEFAGHVAQTVTGNMMRAGFDELINRERTSVSSRESERSAQARNGLRLSRSQQAAALMMELQKAQRNM